jgi:hypothetical protein
MDRNRWWNKQVHAPIKGKFNLHEQCQEGVSADFHKFEFAAADANKPEYEYYNQPWFQMCFFLEHSFRNAIAG